MNVEEVASRLIPLPSANEQRRIVAKIEELTDMCDELEGQIACKQTGANDLNDLMAAVTYHLVVGAA